MHVVSDRVLAVLSQFYYVANAVAPPNKLPPELLRMVFFHLRPSTDHDWETEQTPPYANLFAVSRVCRCWREVAISASELWTHIILSASRAVPLEKEISTARLCMSRSGGQPLDFFYTALFCRSHGASEFVPDRHRLRSVVYGYPDDSRTTGELVKFLLSASNLGRLEIRTHESFSLPILFPNTIPPLRELTLLRCSPWPNNQLGLLTSLYLLRQKEVSTNIHHLANALRCSPNLEELFLEGGFDDSATQRQLPSGDIPTIPLRSLKKLHLCRLSAGTTRRLLHAFDLHPGEILMRFSNISADLDAIFPEAIAPKVSPRAVTKLELIYPSRGGVILHSTSGAACTRLAYNRFSRQDGLLDWVARGPNKGCSLKELWLHSCSNAHYEIPPPLALRNLETLVIEADPNEKFNFVFLPMLFSREGGVPSPLLSTLELRDVVDVKKFGEILKARADAGFRLKTLRARWFEGCEARMAPLFQFVDNLEFYRVTDKATRGLELPEGCMKKSRWWEPWSRKFVGEMECERAVGWACEVRRMELICILALLNQSTHWLALQQLDLGP